MAQTLGFRCMRTALAASLSIGASSGAVGLPGPAGVLLALEAGNLRFATAPEPHLPRKAASPPPAPLAAVLSCAEARVPAERIFDLAPGELFVVHSAGAVADRSALAGLEYAAQVLRVPLLVVMGHASCDIVESAAEGRSRARGPNADYVAASIRPALQRAAATPGADPVKAAILATVEQVVNDALGRSGALSRLVHGGSLQLVGAYFDPSTGHVTFSAPVGSAAIGTARYSAVRGR